MPKKMRRLALRSALSSKFKKTTLIVDTFGFDAPKQKEFKMFNYT